MEAKLETIAQALQASDWEIIESPYEKDLDLVATKNDRQIIYVSFDADRIAYEIFTVTEEGKLSLDAFLKRIEQKKIGTEPTE